MRLVAPREDPPVSVEEALHVLLPQVLDIYIGKPSEGGKEEQVADPLFDGRSWFDLKRWGDSIDRKTYAKGGNWMSSYAVSFGPNEKNNWTWCIPRNETDYNKGITSTANE